MSAPKITFVGTPIGNLDDMSPRARAAVHEADIIYSEHPETSKKLCRHFEMPPKKWVLCDQKNEASLVARIIRDSRTQRVVVVARAGMPGMNDPGTAIIRHLMDHQISFDYIPGPSIVSCLIAMSGTLGPHFYFGYFPKSAKEARHQLFYVAACGAAALYLESPHRILKTLRWLQSECADAGDAYISVLHELTKIHQTMYGGLLAEMPLSDDASQVQQLPLTPPLGEWAFSLHVPKILPQSPWRIVDVNDLNNLIRHPYPERAEKFKKKYRLLD